MSSRIDLKQNDKRKNERFSRFLLPAFLAVMLHLALLGFKKEKPSGNNNIIKSKHVMLLPVDAHLPSEKNLIAWMNILDPSYFFIPDRVHGFSTTFHPEKIKDSPLVLEKNIADDYNRDTKLLPVPWQNIHDRVKSVWLYKPVKIVPLDVSRFVKNLQYPVWMSEKSDVFPQLFENITNVKKIISEARPPSDETVLKADFFGPNLFPEVEVAVSCGNKNLDDMACRTLIIQGRRLAINDKDSKEPYYITVKWYENRYGTE